MKCCLASSRDRTTILAGVPSSPPSSLRTRTCPSEPVPPVTSTRFPDSGPVLIQLPPDSAPSLACASAALRRRPFGGAAVARDDLLADRARIEAAPRGFNIDRARSIDQPVVAEGFSE